MVNAARGAVRDWGFCCDNVRTASFFPLLCCDVMYGDGVGEQINSHVIKRRGKEMDFTAEQLGNE